MYEVAGVRGEGSEEETAGGAMATAPEEEGGSPRANAAVTTFRFIMKQSYICALIAMMVSRMCVCPLCLSEEQGTVCLFSPRRRRGLQDTHTHTHSLPVANLVISGDSLKPAPVDPG